MLQLGILLVWMLTITSSACISANHLNKGIDHDMATGQVGHIKMLCTLLRPALNAQALFKNIRNALISNFFSFFDTCRCTSTAAVKWS